MALSIMPGKNNGSGGRNIKGNQPTSPKYSSFESLKWQRGTKRRTFIDLKLKFFIVYLFNNNKKKGLQKLLLHTLRYI